MAAFQDWVGVENLVLRAAHLGPEEFADGGEDYMTFKKNRLPT
jgi:hypothetical protein